MENCYRVFFDWFTKVISVGVQTKLAPLSLIDTNMFEDCSIIYLFITHSPRLRHNLLLDTTLVSCMFIWFSLTIIGEGLAFVLFDFARCFPHWQKKTDKLVMSCRLFPCHQHNLVILGEKLGLCLPMLQDHQNNWNNIHFAAIFEVNWLLIWLILVSTDQS